MSMDYQFTERPAYRPDFLYGHDRVISRKAGRIEVTLELLKQLLSIPEDTVITKAHVSSDKLGILTLVVESPNLSPVKEGEVLPYVTIERLSGFDE